MNIDTSKSSFRDITMAFDSLEIDQIDTSKLKALLDEKPIVFDTPPLVVVFFPAAGFIIQMGDDRIRLTHQQVTDDPTALPLWTIATTCYRLVKGARMKAYGFNFKIECQTDPDLFGQLTDGKFIANRGEVEGSLGGKITSFIPRVKFGRGAVQYDLIMEPIDTEHFLAHLNVHFALNSLPKATKLKAEFLNELDEFGRVLHRLFEFGQE